MRVALDHLPKHKFKDSFQDGLNSIWNCGEDIETSSYYILQCQASLQESITLLNTASRIFPNIFDLNIAQLTEILLYGKENLDNINNASLLDATIKSLIETKRFDVQLFWFSTDAMALILILLWISIFSLFSCFVLFLLLSFYYFQIIIVIFVPRFINIYMSKCQYI